MQAAFLVGMIFLAAFKMYELFIQEDSELDPCKEEYRSLLRCIEAATSYAEVAHIESEIEDFYEAYEKFVEIELLNDRWKHLNQMCRDKQHVLLLAESKMIANKDIDEVKRTDFITAN